MFGACSRKPTAGFRKPSAIKERALETGKMIKEVTDNIGRLGNRLGEFVEDMVKPGSVSYTHLTLPTNREV